MSRFGHTKTRKGIFMIGPRPSLDLMPPARVIAGPRALLTSILLVTRVPYRGDRGLAGEPSHIDNAWRRLVVPQVPPARSKGRGNQSDSLSG
jgi:hypothetical protein